MSEVIKFKYYVDIGSEIVESIFTLDQIEERIFTHDKIYELARCQYIGLKDSKKEELFNGDIITNGHSTEVIKPCNGGWAPFIPMMETDNSWHWTKIGNINEVKG